MFPHGIWDNPMWKSAARAGLRRISQMVSQGNIAGASQLAKTPGVLKPSAAGSQIRHLGAGGEGTADLVAHPQHGVAVRKLYDPQGLASQEMIQRKEQVGRAVGASNPNIAQFYGSAPTPEGGGTMHFSEFVNGQGPHAAPAPGSRQEAQALRHATNQTQIGARQAGFTGAKDVRRDNMQWDGSSGQFKSIDSMPYHRGEYVEMRQNKPNQPAWMQDRPSGQSLAIEDPHLQAEFMHKDPSQRRDVQSMLGPTGRNEAVSNPMAVPMDQRMSASSLKNVMLGGGGAAQQAGLAAGSHNLTAAASPRARSATPAPAPATAAQRPMAMKPQAPGTFTRAFNAIQS